MKKKIIILTLLAFCMVSLAQKEEPLVIFLPPTPELTIELDKVKKDREFIEEQLIKSKDTLARWSKNDAKKLRLAEEANIKDLEKLGFDDKMQEAYNLLGEWYSFEFSMIKIDRKYKMQIAAIDKEEEERKAQSKTMDEIVEEGLKNLMTFEEFCEEKKRKEEEMMSKQNHQELNRNALLLKNSESERLNETYKDIKASAIDKWGSDHTMILYTINQQSNAFIEMVDVSDRADFDENIMTDAINKWGSINGDKIKGDWVMIMYEYKNQFQAKSAY